MAEVLQPSPADVAWLTLDELKAHLNITHDWDDPLLTQLILRSSTAISLYLHPRSEPAWVDSTTTPADVKQAVLLLAGAYWADRGDEPKGAATTIWTDIGLLLARRKDLSIA